MKPWENEPDEWEAEMVYLLRHPFHGAWCGYVGIPEGHQYFGKNYQELDHLEVHGGLTYSADHRPLHEPDGLWWFGFDCAHGFDFAPQLHKDITKLGLPFSALLTDENGYRTLDYVKKQALHLAKQLAAQYRPGIMEA